MKKKLVGAILKIFIKSHPGTPLKEVRNKTKKVKCLDFNTLQIRVA